MSGKVFSSLEESFSASYRLTRLLNLENALSTSASNPAKRRTILQKVASIWETFLKRQENAFSETAHGMIEAFESCSKGSPLRRSMPESLTRYMVFAISLAKTMEDLQLLSEMILKDCRTLSVTEAPVSKSSVGKFGPTLLVGYSNPGQQLKNWIAYVLKWTDSRETAGYMAYKAFLAEIGDPILRIPEYGWYDFKNQIYLDAKGTLNSMDWETAESLEASFLSIPHLLNPAIKINGDQLLVVERISGENLGEFARFKYGKLDDDHRRALFRGLGKVAVLDLLLGNTDRLLHLKWAEKNGLILDDAGFNVGNLMIVQGKSGAPSIYCIDNAVDEYFLRSEEKRREYSELFRALFSREGVEEAIASALLKSLYSGFYCLPDDCPSQRRPGDSPIDVGRISRELDPIKRDIKTNPFVRRALEEGAGEMICQLKALAPVWKDADPNQLKEELRLLYPEFLDALEERISIFDESVKVRVQGVGFFVGFACMCPQIPGCVERKWCS